MKTGALIVAAGRLPAQRAFDPFQKIGSMSVSKRLAATFQRAGVETILFVASEAEHQKLGRELARMKAILIHGEDAGAEMFRNICDGLSYLAEFCEQILVTPVHKPMFSPETVKRLMACGRKLATPVYEGVRGHPLLLRSEVVPSLLAYTGDQGLWGAVEDCEYKVSSVPVSDAGVLISAQQGERCEEIAAAHGLNQWRPVIRVQIAREQVFLGPGVSQLLHTVDHTGSVQTACQQMGLSYSKAWKMLNNLEAEIGRELVNRKKGGRHGGETRLTKAGAALLAWYDEYERACDLAAQGMFTVPPLD